MSPEEFDEFYAGSHRRLVGQLCAMTGNLTEAQDVVQEAFVRAWDKRSQFDAAQFPEAWVRTVAWRLAISRFRRAKGALLAWQRHHLLQPAAPSDSFDSFDPQLLDALRQLSDVQRQAVVLHYLVDLPIDQIARETGAPVGTIKARLSRARAALADLLSSPDDSETRNA